MGQVLHGSATTTEAIRRAIQHSQASLRALAKRYGINQKTVAKWKKRTSVADLPTGPKDAKSTVLSIEEEAIIVAFRRHTLLPLDDCLYALQPTIPHLTRSSLHRCLQRHGISQSAARSKATSRPSKKFKAYPIGYFHIDIAEVRTAEGKLYSSSRSTAPPNSPSSSCTRRPDVRPTARASSRPDRGRALQDPHRADRQRHPVHHSRRDTPTGRTGAIDMDPPCFEHACASKRHRASPHQAQASLDQWPGRAHEPHHQGSDRQALPLRQPRPASKHISPTSSPPTTSPGGSRP